MPLGRRRRVRRRRAVAVAGGAYAVHKHHQHQQMDQQAQDDQYADAPAEEYAEEPEQAAPAGRDVASQLTDLKGLLDSGAITQAEFDAEKQKILAP